MKAKLDSNERQKTTKTTKTQNHNRHQPKQPMKSMKTTIYSIHILAAFLAAMFLSACGGSSNSPEGVAKQFFTAVTEGDIKAAAACATKANQQDGSIAVLIGLEEAKRPEGVFCQLCAKQNLVPRAG